MARNAVGERRAVYFGGWGSEAAQAEYNRFIARLAAEAAAKPPSAVKCQITDHTVNEVTVAYARHVAGYYKPASSEVQTFKLTVRPLKERYGHALVSQFGPRCLKELQKHFVAQGLKRSEVNRRTGVVKRMFKWLAAEEMVPVGVYHALATVDGLRRGRTPAAESEPVRPVADDLVEATLPHLTRPVAGLVKFQRLTGCRPGEACGLRMADVETLIDVWVYRPPQHKGEHRGKTKVIVIGPRAQHLLAEFLPADPTEYVFSPARGMLETRRLRAERRVTPAYPAHLRRNEAKRKANPKRAPRARYRNSSYARSIAMAIKRANKKLPPEGQLAHWHPNQLRHALGTQVRQRYGLEAAQAALGHDRMSTTEIYAEKNLDLAVKVAREVG